MVPAIATRCSGPSLELLRIHGETYVSYRDHLSIYRDGATPSLFIVTHGFLDGSSDGLRVVGIVPSVMVYPSASHVYDASSSISGYGVSRMVCVRRHHTSMRMEKHGYEVSSGIINHTRVSASSPSVGRFRVHHTAARTISVLVSTSH